ncbi:hypothetical protein CVU37_09875 [candidate division BRC1 bacterium HGW-BRC1-1]|nr:MAG: hypothetical protein CVU37_09875 [candidate division BRC1 bacterium HGW-BRC1-1]
MGRMGGMGRMGVMRIMGEMAEMVFHKSHSSHPLPPHGSSGSARLTLGTRAASAARRASWANSPVRRKYSVSRTTRGIMGSAACMNGTSTKSAAPGRRVLSTSTMPSLSPGSSFRMPTPSPLPPAIMPNSHVGGPNSDRKRLSRRSCCPAGPSIRRYAIKSPNIPAMVAP